MNFTEAKKILTEAAGIIFISAAVAFIVNIFHPSGFALTDKKNGAGKLVHITGQEAKIKYDHRAAVFIDSRPGSEYREKHIDGAVSIPAGPESVSNRKIKENLGLLKDPLELVIYCNGESCGASTDLAKKLSGLGYSRHIYIIKNGFPEWAALGYPVKVNEGMK